MVEKAGSTPAGERLARIETQVEGVVASLGRIESVVPVVATIRERVDNIPGMVEAAMKQAAQTGLSAIEQVAAVRKELADTKTDYEARLRSVERSKYALPASLLGSLIAGVALAVSIVGK